MYFRFDSRASWIALRKRDCLPRMLQKRWNPSRFYTCHAGAAIKLPAAGQVSDRSDNNDNQTNMTVAFNQHYTILKIPVYPASSFRGLHFVRVVPTLWMSQVIFLKPREPTLSVSWERCEFTENHIRTSGNMFLYCADFFSYQDNRHG